MDNHINITRIKAVQNVLSRLNEKIVFVGGATVSLYADRTVFEVRPTDDVDVLVELVSYNERSQLEQKLREVGFKHDIKSGIVCRYQIQGITVDIMPTNDESIGFKNIWYPEGFQQAVQYTIDDQHKVYILSPPHFIATKLEAFQSRGNNDGRLSHDFEDIIFVLENRSSIWEELKSCGIKLQEYLQREFRNLLKQDFHKEWIQAHIEPNNTSSLEKIFEGINRFLE